MICENKFIGVQMHALPRCIYYDVFIYKLADPALRAGQLGVWDVICRICGVAPKNSGTAGW